jgi:hypothetical protein
MIRNIAFALSMCLSIFARAQDNGPEMADQLRNDGKIYVVIAVIGIIFVCIVLFLVYIERKLKKLEDQVVNKERP